MLTIVGNGPSRQDVDLNNIGEWWGCNAIYRDGYHPDILWAGDIPIQSEIVYSQYYKHGKVGVCGEWLPFEMDMLYLMQQGFVQSGQEQRTFIDDSDTHFVVQGNDDHVDFVGFHKDYINNFITYDDVRLRNLFTGMGALGYAMSTGKKEITLLGFDALESGNYDNIYSGSNCYPTKYTEESRVIRAQQSQFIALLEEFKEVDVYFKNPLDKTNLVEYNELYYYENSERWILGQGFELGSL